MYFASITLYASDSKIIPLSVTCTERTFYMTEVYPLYVLHGNNIINPGGYAHFPLNLTWDGLGRYLSTQNIYDKSKKYKLLTGENVHDGGGCNECEYHDTPIILSTAAKLRRYLRRLNALTGWRNRFAWVIYEDGHQPRFMRG